MVAAVRTLHDGLRDVAKSVLPDGVVRWVAEQRRRVRFGDLRRTKPISRAYGMARGRPIDRYYIERFLADYAADIHGRVLEIADNNYTREFGGDRVKRSDVLHVCEGNPLATIVDDLAVGTHLPSSAFNCVICTQTLMFVYDVRAAVRTIYRILKPGGVVLCTASGLSQICRWDADQWGDYWRFTSMSLQKIFAESFPDKQLQVQSHGNVLAAVGFLHGLAADELQERELNVRDQDYEMVITVRAVKPAILPKLQA